MKSPANDRKLSYRVKEFCDAVGIGRTLFYALVNDGKLRTITLGGRRLVPASEVERIMSSEAKAA